MRNICRFNHYQKYVLYFLIHLYFHIYDHQEAIESQKVIKSMTGPATEIIGELPTRDRSPSEVCHNRFDSNRIIK